jgi:phage-related protein
MEDGRVHLNVSGHLQSNSVKSAKNIFSLKNDSMEVRTAENLDTNKILSEISDAVSELSSLMASVDEERVNTVPYDGSWNAPQLLRHVSKSMQGMAKAMQMEAKPANRNPAERIEGLKNVFLDFSRKLTQPDFLIPENQVYKKQAAIDELNKSFNGFKVNASRANLHELVEGLPLGPITKLEIVHFVLFHTQRHLHQMKNICAVLKSK